MSSDQPQQQPSTSLVWFVLLDSATGQHYKETTADKVPVSSSADVADFRNAVKKKLKKEKSTILDGIASSQLFVYKNKSSFDKRNSGTEEPLDPTVSLGLLGSKEEVLVVVVPSSMQPSQSQPSSFPLCRIAFFNSICDLPESNRRILFRQDIINPLTSLKKLYIRECYRIIASNINPGINKAVITGTPGIGKSFFIIYLLWKLVREGKRVFFIYHPYNIYYDGKDGIYQFAEGKLPLSSDYSFWNESLWCLFDAKSKKEDDLNKFPYELCTFVISTSPRREMVNDFKKPPVPQVFYMPTWTKDELGEIAELFPHAVDWQDRFEILGGIPRHVLEVTTQTPTEILEAACTECSLNKCVKKIGMNTSEKARMIHFLIHITSDPPFTDSSRVLCITNSPENNSLPQGN